MRWGNSASRLALAMTLVIGVSACDKLKEATGAAPAGPAAVDHKRLLAAESDPANWITHGGSFNEQRFSRLTDVNDSNVGKLSLAWSYDLDTNRGQEATPLVIDGVMYTTTAWSKVVALDAATGKELWTYDPEVPGDRGHSACCDVVNRGLAAFDGKLFLGTLDGRLIAIDAKTGKPVWSVVTVDQSKPYTITGAPRVIKGKVIIGNGGAEFGVRGYVSAYDSKDGKQLWRFYTVPGDPAKGPDGAASDPAMEKARGTWFGDNFYKVGGGGTVWDAIVYDQELDQLYIGVGNGSPWNHKVRSQGKGDNLFLSSVVALNPETGKYIWHYQGTPGETWDYTQTQPIILTTLKIEGKDRKVLMQAPKNGFFYVVDRTDGKLISAKGFVPQSWTSGVDSKTGRPIETANARYTEGALLVQPSYFGAHNWHPMAFSPQTGLVYLPAQEIPMVFGDDAKWKYVPGSFNAAIDLLKNAVPDDPATRKVVRAMLKGQLLAWDPVAQKEVWRVQYDGPWNGGALATAGNLVFQGNARGEFAAYSADKGKKLWAFDAQTGVIAGPISFAVSGTQYVAVMAGYGGAYALASAYTDKPAAIPPNGRVLVFKIGGTASLPPAEKPVTVPANPPATKFTAAQVAEGEYLYEANCGGCHGTSANTGGVLPDLRRSAALNDKAMWDSIVLGGALKDRGMVSFKPYLTPAQVEAVRGYVGAQAVKLAAREAATTPTVPAAGK